jgi:hypothetical protein
MLLSNLNEKQKEAVLAETKRLLVLAGAHHERFLQKCKIRTSLKNFESAAW